MLSIQRKSKDQIIKELEHEVKWLQSQLGDANAIITKQENEIDSLLKEIRELINFHNDEIVYYSNN